MKTCIKTMYQLKQLKEKHDLQKAKAESIHFRNHVLQMQKVANNDNEISRVTGELDHITQGLTNNRLTKRIETLERLKKEII